MGVGWHWKGQQQVTGQGTSEAVSRSAPSQGPRQGSSSSWPCPTKVPEVIMMDTDMVHAVAAAHPVHSLCLRLGRPTPEGAQPLLSCAETCLGQLHTLAIIKSLPECTSLHLRAVAWLLANGKLPALRRLLVQTNKTAWNPAEAPMLWRPSLVRIMQAGCVVHLLPGGWDAARMAAMRELQSSLPDPDMLQVGVRVEAQGGSLG